MTDADETRRLPRIVAVTGALAAVVWSMRVGGGMAVLALMLATTTIVPLGVALARPRGGSALRLYRVIVYALPFDAACGVLGWSAAPDDTGAIVCAGVHVVVSAMIGIFGLARLASRRRKLLASPEELAIDVGLLLLPIGAAWLFASRAAMKPLGFEEPIVLFTAAHFHYAGFAAPVVLGGVGRLASDAAPRAYRVAAASVCAGVPLTAIGITTTHTVEVASAILLACGMLVASALMVFVASPRAWSRSPIAACVLACAGLALVGTMALAATFAT
ncbi:MAG TPA: YndJ family transporter, partial [Labilithrix sp.]